MTFKKESHTVYDIYHALQRMFKFQVGQDTENNNDIVNIADIKFNNNLQIDVEALKHNALLWREYNRVVEYPHIERTFSDNGEPVYYTNRIPEAEPKGVPEPFMPKGKKK